MKQETIIDRFDKEFPNERNIFSGGDLNNLRRKEIHNFLLSELKEEYKRGFNDCLKEQRLTGEEHQHLYL